MKRIIAKHTYKKNNKKICVGITDEVSSVDSFFLEFWDKKKITTHYMRPDEIVLVIKLLSELTLKRVINYEVNLGRKTKKDY